MADIIPTEAVKPTSFSLGAVNIRLRHTAETPPGGPTYPAGSIMAVAVLSGYRGETHTGDLPPISVQDVAAWVGSLAQSADPLAAEAGQRFMRCLSDLKWIAALRSSQLGLCERPTA